MECWRPAESAQGREAPALLPWRCSDFGPLAQSRARDDPKEAPEVDGGSSIILSLEFGGVDDEISFIDSMVV